MTGREDGILWRLARLHPGYVGALVVLSLGLPLSSLASHIELSGLGSAIARLVIFAAEFVCLLVPLLYIYAIILLVSGRFHAPGARRVAGATTCIVILTALTFGIAPMILVLAMMDEQQARTGAIFAVVPFVAGAVSYYHLLAIAAKELESAERGLDASKLRSFATLVALVFWPIGLLWIQARVRSLVGEFDTGVFSRLPLEAVRFSDDDRDEFIPLTRRVRRQHAEAYAEQFVRQAGGSIAGRRKSVRGMSWDIMVDNMPLRLVFTNDPPTFTLHTNDDPESEFLYKVYSRLRESA